MFYDDDLKIKLKKGATTFKSCIEYLKAAPTVKPIELVDDLAIRNSVSIRITSMSALRT